MSAEKLLEGLEVLDASSFSSEAERMRARDRLYNALRRVQSPWDIVWEHNWVNGATNASIRALIQADVFPKIAEAPQTSEDLAKLTGGEAIVFRRLLSQISGQGLVAEVAEDTWGTTPWVEGIVKDPSLASSYDSFYGDLLMPTFLHLGDYLKENGFKNPNDPRRGVWQSYRGEAGGGKTIFEEVATNERWVKSVNDSMEVHSKYNLTPWTTIYPTETIVEGAKPGRALVVDIGGGKGHDLVKFHQKHPGLPEGSLVLQDLPGILANVTVPETITIQSHDFFTPETVQGARVYFMHNVLHDWEDKTTVKILRNIATAMERGYSKVLIHESLVSDFRPLARVTASDIVMMSTLASQERTEKQWRALVAEAGLKMVKVWQPEFAAECVMELELA